MRYVRTRLGDPAPLSSTPLTAARHAVRELRVESERRAWAGRGRPLGGPPVPAHLAARLPGAAAPAAGGAPDGLNGLLDELRTATTRFVCGLREEGARPEQMLVRVKAYVREAMAAEGWHDPEAVQALTARVVGWSIAAYYDR